MEYKEITEKIIGCAFRIYNKMGFGFLESVYEKCMIIELKKLNLNYDTQKKITVFYENEVVGEFLADLIVNDIVIVAIDRREICRRPLKSVKRIVKAHEIQIVNYLVSTKKPVGLIINFGEKKVDVKRKVREL
jgi:GxxExxY protein